MTLRSGTASRGQVWSAVLLVGASILSGALTSAPVHAANAHSLIQGSGSSWSSNAINQWVADVQPNGIQVVYTASGSAQGRNDYANGTTDFAVTEIGYQQNDELTGQEDTSHGREYAYLPIAAGGTSFPYQIRVSGQLVRDLRLSGLTLAKIFTNQITNWADPAITADNNGRVLPSLPIIPVVHSEGSGTSAHFTDYLAHQFPDLWTEFNGNPALTEYYPRHGNTIAQSGSEGVMNFLTSSAANGAIGYDEYSYPLGKDYPVAKIQNAAGYFTLPTQYNVAVALTQADINRDSTSKDYLLQDLARVYTYSDPRTYTLSSYSYMVIPTGAQDRRMTTAKRQTIADFLYYSICDGQREIGPIGYSPLPVNLVQAGFEQVARLRDADAGVDLTQRDVSTCNNPTFDATDLNRNRLAEIAPQPLACDQAGQALCAPDAVAPVSNTVPATTATTVPAGTTPPTTVPPVGSTAPATSSTVTPNSADIPVVGTQGSSDIPVIVTPDSSDLPAVTQTIPPVPVSTAATVPSPVTSPVTSSTLVLAGTGRGPTPTTGPAAPGAALGSADQPEHVDQSASNGILTPIVIGLVALLVLAPAMQIRTVRRRRTGVA
ncbi:MAG: phosphate transporter substrate-binding protein PhoT family [Acidimicrobiales bacterium]|nr:phosphate transporter substrate-binding protein PhoT family [Acidimicrobiales bacterium]